MLAKEQKKKANDYQLDRLTDVNVWEMKDPKWLTNDEIQLEMVWMGETI